jgi:hypothetical protein
MDSGTPDGQKLRQILVAELNSPLTPHPISMGSPEAQQQQFEAHANDVARRQLGGSVDELIKKNGLHPVKPAVPSMMPEGTLRTAEAERDQRTLPAGAQGTQPGSPAGGGGLRTPQGPAK